MPIKHAIWKVGARPELLEATALNSEQQLEIQPTVKDATLLILARLYMINQAVTTGRSRL